VKSGILLNDEIESLVQEGKLIQDAEGKIKPASYDAILGSEYYKDGVFDFFCEEKSFVELEPNELIFVITHETFIMPQNIAGKYYLRQGLTWKGLVLLGAGQLDPGWRGKIVGLLHNFSSNTIRLHYAEHVFTVEFCYTTKPTRKSFPYNEEYQGAMRISDYLEGGTSVQSGLEVFEKSMYKSFTEYSERMSGRFYAGLGAALGLLAFLEVLVGIIALLAYFKR